jgi:hypothetical protein
VGVFERGRVPLSIAEGVVPTGRGSLPAILILLAWRRAALSGEQDTPTGWFALLRSRFSVRVQFQVPGSDRTERRDQAPLN